MIVGFYGGKFLPMHKGHLYCIDAAARQCDKVVVIMFINGEDETLIRKTRNDPELEVSSRIAQLEKVCSLYDNVEFHITMWNSILLTTQTFTVKTELRIGIWKRPS